MTIGCVDSNADSTTSSVYGIEKILLVVGISSCMDYRNWSDYAALICECFYYVLGLFGQSNRNWKCYMLAELMRNYARNASKMFHSSRLLCEIFLHSYQIYVSIILLNKYNLVILLY